MSRRSYVQKALLESSKIKNTIAFTIHLCLNLGEKVPDGKLLLGQAETLK